MNHENTHARALAEAAGYQVHRGTAAIPELCGKYWWTLAREGWSGIEAAPDEFATEDEAWNDAIRAHRDELTKGAAQDSGGSGA